MSCLSLLTANQFRIYIPSRNELDSLEFYSQSFEIPSISMSTSMEDQPKANIALIGDNIDYSPLSVDIVMSESMEIYIALYRWMHNNVITETINTNDLLVYGDNELGMTFVNAWPTDLGGWNVDKSQGDTPVKFNVTFEYDYFELVLTNSS